MKLLINEPDKLQKEGVYKGAIDSLTLDDENIVFQCKVDASGELFPKSMANDTTEGSKFMCFVEAALGRGLTPEEKTNGFNLATLKGKPLCFVLERRRRVTGKGSLSVSVPLPLDFKVQ